MAYTVNQSTCKSCNLCINVCPSNIIGKEDKKVEFISENLGACIKCAQCMAVCPTKSIIIDDFDYENNFKSLPKEIPDYNFFLDLLKHRRSARNYKNKEVPKDILLKIINSAEFAPYGSAPNDVHFTVVTSQEKINKALPIMSDFFNNKIVKWMENGIMRFMIKKKKGEETINTLVHHLYPIAKTGNYDIEKGDRITRDAPALIIYHAENGAEEHSHNSMIYATYAILVAESLGLSATFNGLIPAALNKNNELKDIFEIPHKHDVVISLMLGYPKYKYQRTVVREKTNIKFI